MALPEVAQDRFQPQNDPNGMVSRAAAKITFIAGLWPPKFFATRTRMESCAATSCMGYGNRYGIMRTRISIYDFSRLPVQWVQKW